MGLNPAPSTPGYAYSYGTVSADQLTKVQAQGSTFDVRNFLYDFDGRVTSEFSATDSSGTPNRTVSYTMPYGGLADRGGMDSVIRSVSINDPSSPQIYNYYYDGRNHRVRKQYPNGALDDFFYGQDGRLLSEKSFAYSTNADGNPIEEYIWLAGMPVMTMRSMFDASMNRTPDWSNSVWCYKRNEPAWCGMYDLISDHQGRPVYSLDKFFRITGVGEYDPFGAWNTVKNRVETTHPYAPNTNQILATQLGKTSMYYANSMRAKFSFVDTEYDWVPYWNGDSWDWGVEQDRAEIRDGTAVLAEAKGNKGTYAAWAASNAVVYNIKRKV
jgi:hypothetical protein